MNSFRLLSKLQLISILSTAGATTANPEGDNSDAETMSVALKNWLVENERVTQLPIQVFYEKRVDGFKRLVKTAYISSGLAWPTALSRAKRFNGGSIASSINNKILHRVIERTGKLLSDN